MDKLLKLLQENANVAGSFRLTHSLVVLNANRCELKMAKSLLCMTEGQPKLWLMISSTSRDVIFYENYSHAFKSLSRCYVGICVERRRK